jgi:hypothetical protein
MSETAISHQTEDSEPAVQLADCTEAEAHYYRQLSEQAPPA